MGVCVLAVTFLVAGGKPYYLAGMFPVLLAAGAPIVVGWLRRRGRTTRRVVVTAALGLSLLINCLLMLPLVPADDLADTPIVDINYDAGETVGWPEFAGVVAGVLNSLPATERAGAVVLTGNYGEAGAIDRYGAALGLPAAYSGHNAFWEWGPPVGGRPDDRSDGRRRSGDLAGSAGRELRLRRRRPGRSTTALVWTTRNRAGRCGSAGTRVRRGRRSGRRSGTWVDGRWCDSRNVIRQLRCTAPARPW